MNIKKKLVVSLLALMISLSGTLSVLADGMIIERPDPYSDRWDYSDEAEQQAFINYQNGLQKMIVGVKISGAADKDAIWIFPVPADPAKVVIDVVAELPRMNGEEVSKKAEASLSDAKNLLYGSQIYPLFFRSRNYAYNDSYAGKGLMTASMDGESNTVPQDVVVYETLDKEGMTTQIITAKTADGLYKYFQEKGLKVEKGMIPVLDSYIGKNFSFVVSWINKQVAGGTFESPFLAVESESQLRQLLLDEKFQDSLVYLTNMYPMIGARRTTEGTVAMDLETTVAYLLSDAGKPALSNLLSEAKMLGLFGGAGVMYEELPVIIDDAPIPMPKKLSPNYPNYPSHPAREPVRGVSVMFPTNKIYFPLLPTSVYESKIVPATIKVVGYVTPELFEGINNFAQVDYYTNSSFYAGQGNTNFLGANKATSYTKIKINPPSKYLTDDLWIENTVSAKVVYASWVANHPLAVSVIILIFCSVLSGILAGLVLLKDLRKSIGKLALLGASNCLSIIGLIVAIFYILPRPTNGEDAELMEKLKQKGYIWKRKTAQILFIAAALIMIYFTFISVSSYYSPIPLLLSYFPLAVALVGWFASRVKYEDAPLFAELKAKGYSTWTMRKKGESRKLFIILFSLLFLAVSWLAIKLLAMTV